MPRFAGFLKRLWRWLTFPGPLLRGDQPPDEPPQSFTTGPELVARIVQAIELNQSVVLSGPRGCGKSHCVDMAIQEAMDQGVVPRGARVFLQGNREIPRDYLLEDEIAFRIETQGGQQQVVPYRRSAPIFAFAERNTSTGDPFKNIDGQVNCQRFILFLDEINRFSDGVLDGLLSVLEERKAVLAGVEYRLPVVVCMTMNPPGYDGSARKLSPPLAARISRTYRLVTPDIDTLSDRIISSKIDALRKHYEADRKARQDRRPEFPATPIAILRKVALTTLCLWGDTTGTKAGNEYLTPGTRALLARIMNHDRLVRRAMRQLTELCQFGPDGRAGSDWLVAAIGLALDEATRTRLPQARLLPEHLIKTVVETVAHKVYDSFSAASRPDLTARKEQAVATIARQIFSRPFFGQLVARQVDDEVWLTQPFVGVLTNSRDLTLDFREAGVVENELVRRWHDLAVTFQNELRSLGPRPPGATAVTSPEDVLLRLLEERGLVVPADPADGLRAGFAEVRYEVLARRLAARGGILGVHLRTLLISPDARIGAVRPTLEEELRSSYLIRCIGIDHFLQVCRRNNSPQRSAVLRLVGILETLWAFRYDRDTAAQALTTLAPELEASDGLGVPLEALLPDLIRAAATVREAEAVRYQRFLRQVQAYLRRR